MLVQTGGARFAASLHSALGEEPFGIRGREQLLAVTLATAEDDQHAPERETEPQHGPKRTRTARSVSWLT